MQLLESSKDRHEHDVVVRSVSERMASIARDARGHDQLAVVPAAGGLWHLRRQLELILNEGVDDAAVLGLLHPTPAVCGRPTTTARSHLTGQEGFDRGLYAGPIGLFDGSGHDVAVGIRSLRLSPEKATLFAGAGIVRDSQPEMEFVETEAKLAVARATAVVRHWSWRPVKMTYKLFASTTNDRLDLSLWGGPVSKAVRLRL